MSDARQRRIVVAAVALTIGCYYLWQARAAGTRFEWGRTLDGYYNLLAQGFAAGHLYVPLQPSARFLAAPNPYDPAFQDESRMQDMVLYNGHYYLYFGATPAVLLFTPWRLATGHDLPQNFGLFLLCLGGFLFACGAMLGVLDLAAVRPQVRVLAAMLVALGVCQSAPYLLNRVAAYEIAIGSGYFCVSGGLYFLTRGLMSRSGRWWYAASGLFFGLAVGCRPQLVLAGAAAALALGIRNVRSRDLRYFVAAMAVVGAFIAVYNFERFGSPLEFGFRYQLAGAGQNRLEPGWRNVVPGIYFMLLSRPEFSAVFPWMRMVFRFPFDSAELHPLPPEYFVEPTVGALWLAPFLLVALLVPKCRTAERTVIWTALAGGIAVLGFLISVHLATHRYEVDFVPLLLFAALANAGIWLGRASGWRRSAATAVFLAVVVYSLGANMALGIAGPYDDVLRYRPASYVRLARWFSPLEEFRPMMNPAIRVGLTVEFVTESPGYREPLVTIGHSHYRHFLYVEHMSGGVRLISQSDESKAEYQWENPFAQPQRLAMTYLPESQTMTVTVNGQPVITHKAGPLVTAPAQVEIGMNRSDFGLTARKYFGRIEVTEKGVRPGHVK